MRLGILVVWLLCATSLEAQWRLERVASTAGDSDVGSIGGIAVSRAGSIFAIDTHAQMLVVYDSTGRRLRTIGRKGDGPLEFRGLEQIAWLGDTLAVYDAAAKRITFMKTDGVLVRTKQWDEAGFVHRLLGPGGTSLHALVLSRDPGNVQRQGGYTKNFYALTTAGEPRNIPSMDTTRDPLGYECEDARGMVDIFGDVVGGQGPFNAVLVSGAFAFLNPARDRVVIRNVRGNAIATTAAYRDVPGTRAMWLAEFPERAAAEERGARFDCRPPLTARSFRPIRGMVADDAGGLWLEVLAADGPRYEHLDGAAKRIGWVAAPPKRVRSIPPVVRNGKLYVVEKDTDDVTTVSVYRIRR